MTKALPVRLKDYASALILKPSSLGDIVHTLPAVKALKETAPHLKIRWLANTEWMPLLEGSPVIDEVIEFPRKRFRGLGGFGNARQWGKLFGQMPREAPELVLDFQGLLRSGLAARARGSRPILGLSDAREGAGWFYDHTVEVNKGSHAVDRYLTLVRALGVEVTGPNLDFAMPEGARPKTWSLETDWIAVHPWSRGEGKSLSEETLQALCDALAPHPVVLVGRMEGAKVPQGEHLHDFSNRTSLQELIWVLRQSRFCISVDSGPMHMAAAVNDQTLGIHTWTDPRRVGPYNARAWVWKAGRIDHRQNFSPEECERETGVTAEDVREIGRFVRERL